MLTPDLKRLTALHAPYKKHLALALLAMVVTAATEPLLPYALKLLLDNGFGGKVNFSFWLVPLIVIGIFAMRGASTFASSYLMSYVSTRILNELRRRMFASMLNLPIDFYNTHTVGKVINSIMFEVQQIIEMVTKVFTSIVRSSLTVLGLLAWLLYLNWVLTLVTLVLLPLLTIVVRTTGKRLKQLNRDSLAVNAELTQVIEETTRAQQVIKIFGGQEYEKSRFEERAEQLRRYSMRMTTTFSATVPITQVITAAAVAPGYRDGPAPVGTGPNHGRRLRLLHHGHADAADTVKTAGRSQWPPAARHGRRRGSLPADRQDAGTHGWQAARWPQQRPHRIQGRELCLPWTSGAGPATYRPEHRARTNGRLCRHVRRR